MKKRGRPRKSSAAAALFTSPSPPPPHTTADAVSSPSSPDSHKSFEFKPTTASTRRKPAAATPLKESPSPGVTVMAKSSSIADLKEMAASRRESIKRQVDLAHAEFGREVEGSQARIHKRFKNQTQACQQVMDQADKEHKKISERIAESREAMQASYAEIIAEAQASASRVCKTSIPDLAQSFEKAIGTLRSRYGISAASL